MKAPYSFLADTIRVVAVEKDAETLEQLRSFFSICCLFKLECLPRAREAELVLRSKTRPHVCLCGLGLTDVGGDEFYLLRNYGRRTSFLMISDTSDPRAGYAAGTYGAKGFLQVPDDLSRETVLCSVLQAFIFNIANPQPSYDHPLIKRATQVLVQKGIRNVSEWARELGVSDSYLRRAWSDAFGVRLKHVLFLHNLYTDALDYYEKVCRLNSGNTTMVLARPEYARQYEYFAANKEALVAILS
jgi:AraC-like DNA-binding protein